MPFHVKVEKSGHEFECQDGESVLNAALRAGFAFPYSCKTGTCASCRGRVIEGRIEYPEGWPEAITEEESREGLALFCQAVPETDLVVAVREVEAVRGIRTHVLPARVQSRERLSHDVMRVMLRLPKTPPLDYLAGQYMDVLLPGGRRRAFSIANPPDHVRELEMHIRYVAGGDFTEWVFGDLPRRAVLRLEGPLGTFFVRKDSKRPTLMMAGGTGFAPLKAMVEDLLAAGLDRPLHLYWGARRREDLYMADLPERWAEEHERIHFTPVLSEPGRDWRGRTGFVHEALLADHPDLSDCDVYMSGPPAMIDAARHAFTERHGLPEERLFYDSFEFSPDSKAQRRKQPRTSE